MDKDWLHFSRFSSEYESGARRFIEIARANSNHPDMISCPCTKCRNLRHQNFSTVFEHLVIKGMDPTYTTWVLHGEELPSASSEQKGVDMTWTHRMYRDAHIDDSGDRDAMMDDTGAVLEDRNKRKEPDFMHELAEAETPLYPGCTKYTRISAVVVLFKHKMTNGLTDKSFSELLEILCDMLPHDNTLPNSMYSTKKLLSAFGLGFDKIHACVKDCCLFTKDNKDKEECPKCGSSRWKVNKRSDKIQKGVPAKVLRYFPIIPRLRRLFMSPETAEQLTWHSTHRSTDNKMRHPVDSLAWKRIDQQWPSFASEPRNIRFGLAADGFNPFANLSTSYSCWPVILTIYNLPPWLCMKEEQLMLSLLIPGPKQPGNNIDVYLEPLLDDLKELWNNGVGVYDAFSKSNFTLKAVLMWTINDFPAYANLSGYSTKGKKACPVCGVGTCSKWLHYSHKWAYMGHRRFLAPDHPYRKKRSWFNGKKELKLNPRPVTGRDAWHAVSNVENDWGRKEKGQKKRNINAINPPTPWTKKSLFFELPYWEDLLCRHNLDVMHIEKNICESLVNTLLNVPGKSKDNAKSRADLKKLNIRHALHVDEGARSLPPAPHTLSKSEKKLFCSRLRDLKLPDGYSSNIGNCVSVEQCKIVGLKSHDCHVLLQQLLPVALRGSLPKGTRNAIFRLCAFFNELCQRVLDRNRVEVLEDNIVETLCMFERYFPPSFFDIMIHLSIHVGREARLCGPVQYRWMYPFERYMKVLKGYVRNRARPEGCIAECYAAKECMDFCSGYIKQAAKIGYKHARNEDVEHERILEGRPLSKGVESIMPDDMIQIAHLYVLRNTAEVEPYLDMHVEELKRSERRLSRNETLLQNLHNETFCDWLKEKVHASDSSVSDTLRWLSRGPRKHIKSYSAYVIKGQRFHTRHAIRETQNSGVSIDAETVCRSSARDNAQVVGKISYYGVIEDIILLDYYRFQIPIFKCAWANIVNGIKVDDGFTLVNLEHGLGQFEKDPFILASQAKQVFYSKDVEGLPWYVVLKAPPRGFHELEMFDEDTYMPHNPIDVVRVDLNPIEEDEHYVRPNCEAIEVEDE